MVVFNHTVNPISFGGGDGVPVGMARVEVTEKKDWRRRVDGNLGVDRLKKGLDFVDGSCGVNVEHANDQLGLEIRQVHFQP